MAIQKFGTKSRNSLIGQSFVLGLASHSPNLSDRGSPRTYLGMCTPRKSHPLFPLQASLFRPHKILFVKIGLEEEAEGGKQMLAYFFNFQHG